MDMPTVRTIRDRTRIVTDPLGSSTFSFGFQLVLVHSSDRLTLCVGDIRTIYSDYTTFPGSEIHDKANVTVIYLTTFSDQTLPPANDQHCQRGLDSSSHLYAA